MKLFYSLVAFSLLVVAFFVISYVAIHPDFHYYYLMFGINADSNTIGSYLATNVITGHPNFDIHMFDGIIGYGTHLYDMFGLSPYLINFLMTGFVIFLIIGVFLSIDKIIKNDFVMIFITFNTIIISSIFGKFFAPIIPQFMSIFLLFAIMI